MADMISRQDFKDFVDAILPVLKFRTDENSLRKFVIPVGPYTKATVEFSGPVSIDEYDSLLAHVAYYKTLFPKNDSERPVTKGDVEKLFAHAANIAFGRAVP